jgi:hypothetical protein
MRCGMTDVPVTLQFRLENCCLCHALKRDIATPMRKVYAVQNSKPPWRRMASLAGPATIVASFFASSGCRAFAQMPRV